jgi:endonuclease/exonuclease/phosphatase family metal-dependent hydrolase
MPASFKPAWAKAAALFLLAWLFIAASAHAQPLRVMTFNIRMITEADGPNHWEHRRDLVVAMLRAEQPDVIGTQELIKRQGDEIVAALPEYAWLGEGRRGGSDDEHMGIFYRKDRLRVLESGNFWLSDTPEIPGSITWGNIYPRMVTWARFERLADGARFTLYNTHLPYREADEAARIRCVELILARLNALPENERVIITGDFNTSPESRVHAMLTESFKDAWIAAPRRTGPEGTFHDFKGLAERRIDWILVRGLQPNWARTITTHRDERYPSDHFPLLVELDLPAAADSRARLARGAKSEATARPSRDIP